ncbi:hypothetical protein [Scytonema hofmannii]|uniref:hypothetical protein n=1 Tax=Scytonema hofmannii TaxID=34078 RepID=UPI001640C868|nr:hypothetical protein [Scytonema hofmannii]
MVLPEEKFQARLEASQKIGKWLQNEDNRLSLSEFAISRASSNHNIHEKYMNAFKNDIGRCVNWLRDSVENLRACKVDPEEFTYARRAGMDSGIDPYITALNAIKNHEYLKRLASKTGIVKEMIDYFIQKLSSTSK